VKIRIRSPRDFWAGIAFIGSGSAFLVGSQRFAMGNAANIGPGYFPAVVAGLLVLVGVFLAIEGLAVDGPRIEPMRARPVAFVLSALVAFGLIIDKGGLILATAALVVISSAAGGRFRPLQSVLIAAALIAIAIVVFRVGLGIQVRLWPAA
jgi:putative tricarboxylic transport membrane protein